MKLISVFFSLMATISSPAYANDTEGVDNLPAYSVRYDPQRDPFADGHAAIRLAQQTDRRILIELGGNWCKWCHLMDDFFEQNPDVKSRLHETFVMLKVNVSDANDNKTFLAAFPRPLGYPHMYVAENNGSLLLSKDTAEFLHNGRYSRERFLEFFEYWKRPPTKTTVSQSP